MHVTLNGVVHFKGEAPEVVCCIRPLTEQQLPQQPLSQQKLSHQSKLQVPVAEQQTFPVGGNGNSVGSANSSKDKTMNLAVSCSDGDASRSSDESNGTQQSVLVRHNVLSLRAHEDAVCEAKKWNKKYRRIMHQEEEEVNNSNNNNGGEADGTNNSVRISDGDSLDGLESDQSN